MVTFGILDYAQLDEGVSAEQALQHTVELVQLAESVGFKRFWVAEHHDVPAFASSSPEILMMRLLDATSRIRIGSGGVMIPHYSPYKVAENFHMLEGFHPNRVDLGIGNTVGTPIVNNTLNETKSKKLPYEQNITDIMTYLNDDIDETHRFHGITANPVVATVPELVLLSTSVRSANTAAKLGIGYTFGYFLLANENKYHVGKKVAKNYREQFQPSRTLTHPSLSLAVFVVIADTNEKAEEYAEALDVWLLGKDHFKEFDQFPSVATARKYAYTEQDKTMIERNRNRMVVGDSTEVKKRVVELIEHFTADEVLFVPLLPNIAARKRAVQLLANTFIQ